MQIKALKQAPRIPSEPIYPVTIEVLGLVGIICVAEYNEGLSRSYWLNDRVLCDPGVAAYYLFTLDKYDVHGHLITKDCKKFWFVEDGNGPTSQTGMCFGRTMRVHGAEGNDITLLATTDIPLIKKSIAAYNATIGIENPQCVIQ